MKEGGRDRMGWRAEVSKCQKVAKTKRKIK